MRDNFESACECLCNQVAISPAHKVPDDLRFESLLICPSSNGLEGVFYFFCRTQKESLTECKSPVSQLVIPLDKLGSDTLDAEDASPQVTIR